MGLFNKKRQYSEIKVVNNVLIYYISRLDKVEVKIIKNYCMLSLVSAQITLESLLNQEKYRDLSQIIKYKNQISEEMVKNFLKSMIMYHFIHFTENKSKFVIEKLFDNIKTIFNFNQDDLANFNFLKSIFPKNKEGEGSFFMKYYDYILKIFSDNEKADLFCATFFQGLVCNGLISFYEQLGDGFVDNLKQRKEEKRLNPLN